MTENDDQPVARRPWRLVVLGMVAVTVVIGLVCAWVWFGDYRFGLMGLVVWVGSWALDTVASRGGEGETP